MSWSDSYLGEHTKYPVLISCLSWVNVWAMLNVFPNGEAACRQCTGNKTSDSHITQPVSKTTLFPPPGLSDIWYLQNHWHSGKRKKRNEGEEGKPFKAYKAMEGEGEVIIALFTMKALNWFNLYKRQPVYRTDY